MCLRSGLRVLLPQCLALHISCHFWYWAHLSLAAACQRGLSVAAVSQLFTAELHCFRLSFCALSSHLVWFLPPILYKSNDDCLSFDAIGNIIKVDIPFKSWTTVLWPQSGTKHSSWPKLVIRLGHAAQEAYLATNSAFLDWFQSFLNPWIHSGGTPV